MDFGWIMLCVFLCLGVASYLFDGFCVPFLAEKVWIETAIIFFRVLGYISVSGILIALAFVVHSKFTTFFVLAALAWVILQGLTAFILPYICHFYIVPEIESKIGKKLGYTPSYTIGVPGFDDVYYALTPAARLHARWCRIWSRPFEVAGMIIDTYYPHQKKQYHRWFTYLEYSQAILNESGYTREMISRREWMFGVVTRYAVDGSMLSVLIFSVAFFYLGIV